MLLLCLLTNLSISIGTESPDLICVRVGTTHLVFRPILTCVHLRNLKNHSLNIISVRESRVRNLKVLEQHT